MTGPADREHAGVATFAVVVLFGVLALLLRLYDIGDKSIWLDEAWSWRAARLPLSDMVDWTAQDKHPPLYYGLLHYWIDIFGDRETGLRGLSAVAGAICAAALAGIGWRVGGWPLAIVAGALMAAHPTAIEFSQEARMYPLAGMFGLLATIALAASIDRPSIRRAVLYAALATAAIYTHYSAILLLAVHAGVAVSYAAARWRTDGRRRAMTAGGSFVLIAVAFIPWYGNFLDHARAGVGHLPDPSWTLADVVFSAMLGLQWTSDAWLAIGIPLVGLGLWGLWKRAADPYAICVAAIALVPCLQLFVSIVRTPVFDARQASPYIAGFAFVLALGAVELGAYIADLVSRPALLRPVALAAGGAVGVVMLLGAVDWYDRGPREDWRAAARDVEASPGPAYVWRGYIDEPLRFYTDHRTAAFGPSASPSTPPSPAATLVLSHHTSEEQAAIVRLVGTAYVVAPPVDHVGILVYQLTAR